MAISVIMLEIGVPGHMTGENCNIIQVHVCYYLQLFALGFGCGSVESLSSSVVLNHHLE